MSDPTLERMTSALALKMPSVVRWAGAVAKQLRKHNVALSGKSSGNSNTDALTLADLTVQELLVAALRDCDPIVRQCRVEAEEKTGDLEAFAASSPYVLAIDPIDGTKQFRDKTGNGYAVMFFLRCETTLHYSLVYVPETGTHGTWLEVHDGKVRSGPDDPSRSAREVLDSLTPIGTATRPDSPNIYLIGFQENDPTCAAAVCDAGLKGFAPDEMPGSIFPLFATGEFGGSLIHIPNVYDFPVSLHIARCLGGDAVWVHNEQSVHFRESWLDTRADMIRLPGIVACATNRKTLATLCNLAKDWNPNRYAS